MDGSSARAPRRTDALSRARIIAAAVELLDSAGVDALTMRGLTDHLSTGRGAIYHHISGMADLLESAVDAVLDQALGSVAQDGDPKQEVRSMALRIFDTIDAHPWVGTQLAREPLQPAVLRIWTHVGVRLRRLGVPVATRADAGATLVNYVLGAAAQYTAGARRAGSDAERSRRLEELAAAWIAKDADGVAAEASEQLREHDDRAQFRAGVDIVLAGIATLSD